MKGFGSLITIRIGLSTFEGISANVSIKLRRSPETVKLKHQTNVTKQFLPEAANTKLMGLQNLSDTAMFSNSLNFHRIKSTAGQVPHKQYLLKSGIKLLTKFHAGLPSLFHTGLQLSESKLDLQASR